MNNEMPDQDEAGRETGWRVAWQAFGILLAASVLGIVYNQASPLGVRRLTDETPVQMNRGAEAEGLSQPGLTAIGTLAGSRRATTNLPGGDSSPPNPNPAAQPTGLHFPELKWPAVKALLAANQIVLIDARLKETYELSRIPGAFSLPAYSPVEELQAFVARFPRETRFVIYCNSETCDMSHELAVKLARQFVYTNLTIMPGGFAEYVIAESTSANPKP